MLLLRTSGSGIEILGVGTAEAPSVIPARRSAARSYFERTLVISFD